MFICIEGNIGSGKSTIAKALTHKLNGHFLPEEFEENPLLPLFYNDKETFAFPLEYSFLIDRQKQLFNYFNALEKDKITVSDFHFDKCICYAKANLDKDDFVFYEKHFKAIQNTIKAPNLLVYLEVETDLLLTNIKKRGREIEKELKIDYLKKLEDTFNSYYLNNKNINTLVISIKEYNSQTLEDCCNKIIDCINLHKPQIHIS